MGVRKPARRVYDHEYYLAHRAERLAYSAAWYKANHQRTIRKKREWRIRTNYYDPRKRHLLAKYGMTVAEYDTRALAQGGVCAICGRPPGKRRLHVDHDHQTGKIRGLLCGPCNHGLGLLRELVGLRAAIAYLERY